MIRLLVASLLVFGACAPERVELDQHVLLSAPELSGISIGMPVDEFLEAFPDAELARYSGFSKSWPAGVATYGFSKPCFSDWQPEENCPVRGHLEYVEMWYNLEAAEGQTLFIETWGEFFEPFSEPSSCRDFDVAGSSRGDGSPVETGTGKSAHWDDESGLWATLAGWTSPDVSLDSIQVQYRVGSGKHEHRPHGPGDRSCRPGA